MQDHENMEMTRLNINKSPIQNINFFLKAGNLWNTIVAALKLGPSNRWHQWLPRAY